MENAKKSKLPLICAIGAPIAFVVLSIVLVIVLELTDKKPQYISSYTPPFENYQVEDYDDDVYRFYETINGVMSTNFVDVTVDNEGLITKTDKHIKSYEEIIELNTELDMDSIADQKIKQMGYTDYYIDEEELFYYVSNRKMTPVYLIIFTDSNDNEDGGVVLINANTGNEVDYTEIKDLFE